MTILIYKRTHRGDPDANGVFGIHDCMGSFRDFAYDAVIGVGGIGDNARAHGLAGKVNWIGIGPRKFLAPNGRGPLVVFDHFLLYDTRGPGFLSAAPTLAKRIYDRNVRVLLHDLSSTERQEAAALVKPAYSAPPSPAKLRLISARKTRSCRPLTPNQSLEPAYPAAVQLRR